MPVTLARNNSSGYSELIMQEHVSPDILNEVATEQEQGVEDMYWSAFRFLTLTKQYESVTVDELFQHLKKNDLLLDDDTPDSVYDAILDWADMMNADALEKERVGKVIYIPQTDSFAFAALSTEAAKESVKKQIAARKISAPVLSQTVTERPIAKMPTANEQVVEQPAAEIIDAVIEVPSEEQILDAIETYAGPDGLVKQQALKARFIPEGLDDVTRQRLQDSIQTVIHSLCAKGFISKTQKNNAQWLFVPGEVAPVVSSQERDESQEINTTFAVIIFEALLSQSTHWQERSTIKELWANMNTGASMDKDAELVVKKQCRLLASKGILEAGEAKLRSGRGGMSKAASQRVFKVGFSSQQMKDYAKRAVSDQELLERLLTGELVA